VAVQRGESVHVPGGDDVLKKGDITVLIAPTEASRKIRRLFGIRAEAS